MHVRLLHGSAANLSDKSRTLYIATYYAEDTIKLSQNHLPHTLTHELSRSEASDSSHCTPYEMQLPEVCTDTSFLPSRQSLRPASKPVENKYISMCSR